MSKAKEIADILLKEIALTIDLKYGETVCVMINNLGGTSQMEQYIIAGEVEYQLSKYFYCYYF